MATMSPAPRLHVVVTDGRGRSVAARGLIRWLAMVAPASARGEVVVALVCDAKMRALNRRYRGIDRVTDVLSFPADPLLPRVPGTARFLGDVVVATGVASRQARSNHLPVHQEVRRLSLHGLLHVLGYDHARDNGQMEQLERRLLRKGRIEEPRA